MPKKNHWIFHANCGDNLHELSNTVVVFFCLFFCVFFFLKNKKNTCIINLLSAELAKRVVKVNSWGFFCVFFFKNIVYNKSTKWNISYSPLLMKLMRDCANGQVIT